MLVLVPLQLLFRTHAKAHTTFLGCYDSTRPVFWYLRRPFVRAGMFHTLVHTTLCWSLLLIIVSLLLLVCVSVRDGEATALTPHPFEVVKVAEAMLRSSVGFLRTERFAQLPHAPRHGQQHRGVPLVDALRKKAKRQTKQTYCGGKEQTCGTLENDRQTRQTDIV